MLRLLAAALIGACLAQPTFAQPRTGYVYPDLTLESRTRRGGVSGDAQTSFRDLFPDGVATAGGGVASGEKFHLSGIQWHERGDRPCLLRAWFEHVDRSRPSVSVTLNICTGPARSGQIATFRDDTLGRGGYPVSLAACINNGRLKGVRSQLAEVTGDETLLMENLQIRVVRVDPFRPPGSVTSSTVVSLTSPEGRFTSWDQSAWRLRFEGARTSRCGDGNTGANDWRSFATCNGTNVELNRVVSGVRVFFTGPVITGLQPWCSVLRKLP